eukprot:scaffold26728_cov33-Tisochrysis_lutea.AAC.3
MLREAKANIAAKLPALATGGSTWAEQVSRCRRESEKSQSTRTRPPPPHPVCAPCEWREGAAVACKHLPTRSVCIHCSGWGPDSGPFSSDPAFDRPSIRCLCQPKRA